MKFILALIALFSVGKAVSENIQSITACWILAQNDNAKSKTYNHLIESVAIRTKINDKNVIEKNIMLYMVKQCYPLIKTNQTELVIMSVDRGEYPPITFREIVQGFDYTKYLKELKDTNILKNERLDEIILMIITNLEEAMQQEDDSQNTPLGKSTNYLLILSVIFGIIVIMGLYKAMNILQTSQKTKDKKKE